MSAFSGLSVIAIVDLQLTAHSAICRLAIFGNAQTLENV
jgi:hypothetical protein